MYIYFIQSSVNGHFGCFPVLAIVNTAVMCLFELQFSLYMTRSGTAGSYGSSYF